MDLNIVLLIVLAVVTIGLLIWLLGRRTGSDPVKPAAPAPAPAEKTALTEAEPGPTLAAASVAPVGLVEAIPSLEPVPAPAPAPAPVAKAVAPAAAPKKAAAPAVKAPAEKKPAAVKAVAASPAKAPAKAPAAPKTAAKAPAKIASAPVAPKAAPKKAVAPAAKAPAAKVPAEKAPAPKPPVPAAKPKPAAPAKPKPAAKSTGPDNLLQLKGVGPKLVTLLTGLGVTRFDQIAGWSDTDVARIDPELGTFKGRIVRDKWIEQAGYLATGDVKSFEAKFGKLDSEN